MLGGRKGDSKSVQAWGKVAKRSMRTVALGGSKQGMAHRGTQPCPAPGVPSGKANMSHFSLQSLMDNMPEAHMQGQTVVTQIPAKVTSEQM